ncbi:MAG TPA: NFACT family protein [Limnochordia bacterium]
MALDGIVCAGLRSELAARLTNARISRIVQYRESLFIEWRVLGADLWLVLSGDHRHARAHLGSRPPESGGTPPPFCMLLRKHLQPGRLLAVEQPGLERVLRFRIEGCDSLSRRVERTLICELTGRHTNLVLVDEAGSVLDALRRAGPDAARPLFPGAPYTPPPAQEKRALFDVDPPFLDRLIRHAPPDARLDSLLGSALFGIGPTGARALWRAAGIDPAARAEEIDSRAAAAALLRPLARLRECIEGGRFSPTAWFSTESGLPVDFWALPWSPAPPEAPLVARSYPSFSEMLADCFDAWMAAERAQRLRSELARTVEGALKRLRKKRALQAEAVSEGARAETHQRWGELLLSQQHRVPPGAAEALLSDYFEPGAPAVRIPLDPRLSAVENAERHFARYQKARRTARAAKAELERTVAEIEYLEGVAEAIRQTEGAPAEAWSSLCEIERELASQGYGQKSDGAPGRAGGPPPAPAGPRRFRSPDGFLILVGRNNRQNDEITLRWARPDDIWLHCKEIPGSHVVIRTEGASPPERTLLAGAQLAAYYSRARQSSHVPVDWTLCRYVRKPRGAKPGKVIYDHHHTIYVTPTADALAAESSP